MGLYVIAAGMAVAKGIRGAPSWMFLTPWAAGASLKLAGTAALFAGLLALGRRYGTRPVQGLFLFLLLGAQATITSYAWPIVRMVPCGFDHPSFMFRIWEFGQVFPGALGSYMPLWNAGTEHFVGVTSGAHAWGLLCWPLLQVQEPHVFYGAALLFWFVWAWPWVGVASLRTAGVRPCGALAGGLLLCGANREFFLWMWHFGTVGAITSAIAVLPVVAIGYRVVARREGTLGRTLALALCAFLMCLWTPGAFVAAGLALGALWQWIADAVAQKGWRAADWRRLGWALAAVAAVLLLLSRWWWTVLGPCHNVVDYVSTTWERPALTVILSRGAGHLLADLVEGHPVIIFLGIAGLFAAAPKELRRWVLPLLLVLAAVAGWSKELKPLSQLDRMAIPLVVALILPAAFGIDALFEDRLPRARSSADAVPRRGLRRPAWGAVATWLACGLVLAVLVRGIQTVRDHYANRNCAPLRTWQKSGMPAIVDWIKDNVPPTGRLAFAGKAVHAFGGGNTAYLPVLADREMMGDDYYGFPRGTIEYNYPPRAYRASGAPGYLEWSRLHGITHWIATRPDDLRFFEAAPDAFTPVATFTILPPPFPPPPPPRPPLPRHSILRKNVRFFTFRPSRLLLGPGSTGIPPSSASAAPKKRHF